MVIMAHLDAQVVTRFIWRLLVPLLDLGYQVDVRIMNSVHYAVPQRREVSPTYMSTSVHIWAPSHWASRPPPWMLWSDSAKPFALRGLSTLQLLLAAAHHLCCQAGLPAAFPANTLVSSAGSSAMVQCICSRPVTYGITLHGNTLTFV